MDNTHNKSELIYLLSLTSRKYQITVVQCDNDADTSIVIVASTDATDDSEEVSTSFYLHLFARMLILQVWAEDADLLIMLVLLKYQPSTFFHHV